MRGRGGATRTKHAYTSLGATAVRVTLGPKGRNVAVPVARRAYFPMGDDITQPDITTPTLTDPLAEILANTRETLTRVKADQENRKWALMIAGASALFAAVKLGLVAFPVLRDRSR